MKNKFVMKASCKKGQHEWYISKSFVRGTLQSATEFYCKYCLITANLGEKEMQAHEAQKEQPDLSETD